MTGTTISASSVYVQFGYENIFGGGSTELPLLFGQEQKATGLEFNVNQVPLGQLYSPEIESFVYNRTEGKVSMDYIISHPWNLSSIFGNPKSVVDVGNANLDTHTWVSDPDDTAGEQDPSTRTILSMALEIGYRAFDNNASDSFKRVILGAISPTMSFKMSLNEPVRVTQDIMWGKESRTTGILSGLSSIGTNDDFTPYVFANAEITVNNVVVATVQDFDLNINSNADLLYELGSRDATNAWRKIIEMTGKLNLTIQNSDFYDFVFNRTEIPNAVEMKVTLIQGVAQSDDEKSIVMTFEGVSFGKYNNTGIEPGELALQDVDFQCRSVTIIATNDKTTQPVSNV